MSKSLFSFFRRAPAGRLSDDAENLSGHSFSSFPLTMLSMKKPVLFFALFAGFEALASAATFTVNNNNPSPGQYSTMAAAMGAANNGDTILLHGSPTVYDIGGNIDKSLTILGTGHHPVKDNPLVAQLGFSGRSISAPNVNIKGVVITNGFYLSGANCAISGCKINSFYIYNGAAGLILTNNIFPNTGDYSLLFSVTNMSNSIIENNIFESRALFYFDYGAGATGVTVRNNVFLGNSASGSNQDYRPSSGLGSPTNWSFQNNIFWNVKFSSVINCAFINNITYSPNGDVLPLVNGGLNVGNIYADPQFVSYDGNGVSAGQNLRLAQGSPALLAGSDGTDVGPYGGATPHTDHGMPDIPVVQSLSIGTSSVPAGGVIQVTFQSHIQN